MGDEEYDEVGICLTKILNQRFRYHDFNAYHEQTSDSKFRDYTKKDLEHGTNSKENQFHLGLSRRNLLLFITFCLRVAQFLYRLPILLFSPNQPYYLPTLLVTLRGMTIKNRLLNWFSVSNSDVFKTISLLFAVIVLTISVGQTFLTVIFLEIILRVSMISMKLLCGIVEIRSFSPSLTKVIISTIEFIQTLYSQVSLEKELSGRYFNDMKNNQTWLKYDENIGRTVPPTGLEINKYLSNQVQNSTQHLSENSLLHQQSMDFAWAMKKWTTLTHQKGSHQTQNNRDNLALTESRGGRINTIISNEACQSYSTPQRSREKIPSKYGTLNSNPSTPTSREKNSFPSVYIPLNKSEEKSFEGIEVCKEKSPNEKKKKSKQRDTKKGNMDMFLNYSHAENLLAEENYALNSPETAPSIDGSTTISPGKSSLTDWVDVGTRLGIRLLNSESVKNISRDTLSVSVRKKIESTIVSDTDISFDVHNELAEEDSTGDESSLETHNKEIKYTETENLPERKRRPSFPVHPMWTSPTSMALDLNTTSFNESSHAHAKIENRYNNEEVDFVEQARNLLDTPAAARKPFFFNEEYPSTAIITQSPSLHIREEIVENSLDIHNPEKCSQISEPKSCTFSTQRKDASIEKVQNLNMGKQDELYNDFTPQIHLNECIGEMDAQIEMRHVSPICNKQNATLLLKKSKTPDLTLSPKRSQPNKRHSKILPGCKIVVPVLSQVGLMQSYKSKTTKTAKYMMATVVSCQRIKLSVRDRSFKFSHGLKIIGTNCLSISAQIDKSYLKNGNFAEIHLRIPDELSHMPRHSCYPIGSCVATSFGIGVLAGWRVSDDIHIIRSLWNHRGHGSACAYLSRDKIHSIIEAGIGFVVQTKLGRGKVLSYVQGGKKQMNGTFFVLIKESGRFQGRVVELKRCEILSCPSAKFVPVIEQIRAAAHFQIQMDSYKAALKQWDIETKEALKWSEEIEILFASFIKAVAEDPHFDSELKHLTDALISFLEDLDIGNMNKDDRRTDVRVLNAPISTMDKQVDIDNTNTLFSNSETLHNSSSRTEPGLMFINDLLGGIFRANGEQEKEIASKSPASSEKGSEAIERESYDYDRAYAIIRMIKRALAIAQADVGSTRTDLRLALSIVSEFVVFFQAVIKVRQINVSKEAADIRFRTFEQVRETIYPIQNRFAKVGEGIMSRLENHGKKAKARLAYLVQTLVKDEKLLYALEHGKWETCLSRIEHDVIKAKIVDSNTCAQFHDKIILIYQSLAPRASNSEAAALRSGEKIAFFARIMKWLSEPRRAVLKFITRDDVLEVLERILVRVLHGNDHLSQVINIYAFNVRSFRYFRMLINMELSGKLWIPFLDAADDEVSWAVTRMPENTKEFIVPLAKLFSLGVASFRELKNAELAANWMNFLTEEPARSFIHDVDMKLVLCVEAFCNDIKQTMTILPYYASLDDDILNLLQEVDLDELLNEMSVAILDKATFSKFLIEKSREAVNRFLHYLPKMSIPVERRDISEGWVLTCRGKNGGDLTLSEVNIESENLLCKVLGSSNVLSSKGRIFSSDSEPQVPSTPFESDNDSDSLTTEVSILNHVKELILNAQHYGSWRHGRGGVDHNISLTGTPLEGIPISQVLSCAVELWQNLEIDDDELMEIVIRDVSYQIECQKDSDDTDTLNKQDEKYNSSRQYDRGVEEAPFLQKRFNPRVDPTVLDLDLCGMTFNLDEFLFRVEPKIRYSIFDPVFEGYGSLLIKNTSIKLKVECRKERIMKLGSEVTVPVLQLQELEISLDKVKFKFKDTGADWMLNKAVGGFTKNITQIVESNLKDQIISQIHLALEHLNAFIEVNPDIMLKVLGITIDDLEENIVWV